MWLVRSAFVVLSAVSLAACGGEEGSVAGSLSQPGQAKEVKEAKVTICHLPPGNPANVQMITVGASAVAAHVANHGDGVCAQDANTCCVANNHAACVNLQSDPDNCGACGNSCNGGNCVNGVCESGCPCISPPNPQRSASKCPTLDNGSLYLCDNFQEVCRPAIGNVANAVCDACRLQYGLDHCMGQ